MTQAAASPDSRDRETQPHELRDLVHDLRSLIHEPGATAGQKIGDAWVSAVRAHLEALHERLLAQFHEEARKGLPPALIAGVPHIADRVASLRREHDRILLELRTLVEAADNVLVQGPPAYSRLQKGTIEALQDLVRCEDIEMDDPLFVYS